MWDVGVYERVRPKRNVDMQQEHREIESDSSNRRRKRINIKHNQAQWGLS